MTDDKIMDLMNWPRRYGAPPVDMARVKKVIEAAQQEEREACRAEILGNVRLTFPGEL